MEDNDYVLAFDHFYTTNHIQILKSLLPFMDNSNFQMLPAVIKYMELKYTLSLINSGNAPLHQGISACSNSAESGAANGDSASDNSMSGASTSGKSPFNNSASAQETPDIGSHLEQIYHAVHRYLAPNEEKSFNQILSAFRTMKNMREMQQMLELIQSMNPDMDLGADLGNLGNLANLGNLEGLGNINGTDINEMMQLFHSLK